MRALSNDFAWARPSIGRRIGVVLLVLNIAAALVLAWAYVQDRQELDTWQSDWERLNRIASERRSTGTPEDRERLKHELRYANRVIDKLSLPWDAVFGAVEQAFDEQAILLRVEPDPERRQVRLSAEAKDTSAMLAYLRKVRETVVLSDAYLLSHQVNQQDPQHPVRFEIEAHWADAATAGPTPVADSPAPTAR